MTETKKIERKRLIIYLVLAFVISWGYILSFVFTGNKELFLQTNVYGIIGMFAPLLAALITRAVTKEGFSRKTENPMLMGISFRNKKWLFFILAILLPLVYIDAGHALKLQIFPELKLAASTQSALGLTQERMISSYLNQIVYGILFTVVAFGEEGGWRGYMLPKLTKLAGIKWAVVIGGVIWGLWHSPMIVLGSNFGTKYPGYPYLGILFMCVYGIFMNAILSYLTVKTRSVWAAALLHGINNAVPSFLGFYVNAYKQSGMNQLVVQGIAAIPVVFFGIIAFVLLAQSNCSFEREDSAVAETETLPS